MRAARELAHLKPERSIPGSWRSELKLLGENRPGPSDARTTVGISGLAVALRRHRLAGKGIPKPKRH